jgi:hypothetical protein
LFAALRPGSRLRRAVFAKARDSVEMELSEPAAKFYYRPDEGKIRSLTIVAYWDQSFYVWVVWKGEEGEREDVHVRIGNDALRRTEFPEFDHLLVEL